MFEHRQIDKLADFFTRLKERPGKGVYFYRINAYSQEIGDFIKMYYDTARRTGVVIEGKIPNPDEKNLAYYGEIMGMDFQMSEEFISNSLKKWLPRMNDLPRQNVASSIFHSLASMKKAGKNENILKNAYIKFMCWFYYKFERIVNRLGDDDVPKILYEGDISNYELVILSILSGAGCDILLLQYHGDAGYLGLDPGSALSLEYRADGTCAFPEGYCIKNIRDEIKREQDNARLYGTKPSIEPCTNAWIKGKALDDIRTGTTARGDDGRFFYNVFCRINGAEDKLTYSDELFRFAQEIKNSGRNIVIEDGGLLNPAPSEVSGIKRANYERTDQMISGLSSNIRYASNPELERLMHKAFADLMLEEEKRTGDNINRLTGKAVYLLCWLNRYRQMLFPNWKYPDIACFVYFGGCKNDNEALFMRFLGRLPVDVLILCPNLNFKCCLCDRLLYEENYTVSVNLLKYPKENSQVKISTAAYQAERELDTLIYQDTGLYRNRQFSKANIITLQTMYEEIKILWDEELKYRPSFSTVDGVVNIPVIFAKVNGVKDGDTEEYWQDIKKLFLKDTLLITQAPFIRPSDNNPMKPFVSAFYKNGRLLREEIKNHPRYPYGILRSDMQEFMLDKLEDLIAQKRIAGIGQNGTEYTVIAQVLNLPQGIIRMIQQFDFTKKNPKLIYINTGENMISLEDSILTCYLNMIGFDVLFFVPTGYQNVEKYFSQKLMEDYQIGEYKYDLVVPDLAKLPIKNKRQTWRDKIFKRGE